MFGFLNKLMRSAKVPIYVERWYFLISSRPLNSIDFLNDKYVLPEAKLPPLFEFDTIYLYLFGSDGDESSCLDKIMCKDIGSIEIADMETYQK
jgi:hypothetical protein